MTLGRKTLLLQLLVSIGSILLSIVVLRATVFPSFVSIENDLVELNEKRVLAAITELDRFMLAMAGDYAGWTPTYEFVENPTDDYIEDNVSAPTLRNMNAHAVALLDVNREIIAEYLLTEDSDEKLNFHDVVIDPEAVLAAVDASENDKVRKTGIVQTRLGPMAVAAYPILTNSQQGVPRGTFLFGTLISDKFIAKISERLSVDVRSVYRDSGDWPGPDNMNRVDNDRSNERDIFSHRKLSDIFGDPVIVLEFRIPKDVSYAGQRALLLAVAFLAMSAIVILIVSFFSLKHMVIGPLGGLTDHITKMGARSDLSNHLAVSRNDEIGALATEFNSLIERLAHSQEEMAVARDKMEEARDEAQYASQAKSQFLANMSHEIRTPMNGVLGMTELLLDSDQLGPKERRFAETVKSSAQSLLTIINDILDISKIEAGKMELDSAPFDLRECIEDTLELLAASAHEKRLDLVGDIAVDLPGIVIGDETRLRQVMINLVGNAIKFTESGRVVVTVSAEETSNGVSDVHFSVSDTGIGIATSDQSGIYKSFSQADGSNNRRFGGTGLGLAISRQIVSLMGSRIELDSELGAGSTFSFVVEFKHGAAPSADQQPSDLSDKSVLIIDDNETNRDILRSQMEMWGIRVVDADCGANGLAKLARSVAQPDRPIDLVLVDENMPGLSGSDVIAEIRKMPEFDDLPVVVMSSATRSLVIDERSDLGVSACLTKPVRQSRLRTCLVSVFASHELESLDESAAPGRSFNARVLLVEDNAVNQQVAASMLRRLGCTVDIANDGVEGVEAFEQQSYDIVLMDCQMPRLDGFAATRRIRVHEASQHAGRTPIVAITANALTGDRENCIEAGMDCYLSKPFTQEELNRLLVERLPAELAESSANPVCESSRVFLPEDDDASLDLAALEPVMELQGPDGTPLLISLVELYENDARQLLDMLEESCNREDSAATSAAAHRLKSSSGNLGARIVAKHSATLEDMARNCNLTDASSLMQSLKREFARAITALKDEVALIEPDRLKL